MREKVQHTWYKRPWSLEWLTKVWTGKIYPCVHKEAMQTVVVVSPIGADRLMSRHGGRRLVKSRDELRVVVNQAFHQPASEEVMMHRISRRGVLLVPTNRPLFSAKTKVQ